MKKLSIYLAGPMSGLSCRTVLNRYKKTTKRLRDMGFKIYTPMAGEKYLAKEVNFLAEGVKDPNPENTNRAIVGRDRWMVKQADIIFAFYARKKSGFYRYMHGNSLGF